MGVPGLFEHGYMNKVKGIAPANLLAYWPQWEPRGTLINDLSGNGRIGTYTGVTLGQPGIGDGYTSPLYDGANDVGNCYSASLATAFSALTGTLHIWARVYNAAVWVDHTARLVAYFGADVSDNRVMILTNVSDQLVWTYTANGVTNSVTDSGNSISTTDWMALGLTWDKGADAVMGYYAGAQFDSTQSGLDVWAGALASTLCTLGSKGATPALVWNGYLAHAALWDAVLTPADMAALAEV